MTNRREKILIDICSSFFHGSPAQRDQLIESWPRRTEAEPRVEPLAVGVGSGANFHALVSFFSFLNVTGEKSPGGAART